MKAIEFKDLIKCIRMTAYGSSLYEFESQFSYSFKDNFQWLSYRILSEPNENSFPLVSALFDLLEATNLTGINKIDEFIVKCGGFYSPLFMGALNARDYEQDSFLQELISKIGLFSKENKDTLALFKEYRNSYECYQLVNRKLYPNFDDPVIGRLIDDYCILEKYEILTRFEKYIESGWFDFDDNFAEHFKGNITFAQLKANLCQSMGSKFIYASIFPKRIMNFTEYELFINENKTLNSRIFKLSPSKALDYCIKGVNGEFFIGDVFTTNLNCKNKKRWFNALRASKKFKDNDTRKIKYSVSVNTSSYRYIENMEEKSTVVALDFLSLISTFDTEDIDYGFSCSQLLENCELIILGSDTDVFINDEVLSKGVLAINNFAIGSANLILDKVLREEDLLENSVIIQNLSDALGGLESMISYDQYILNNLIEISDKLQLISSSMPQNGLSKQISTISNRFSMPKLIHDGFNRNKLNFNNANESYRRHKLYNQQYDNKVRSDKNFHHFKNTINLFNSFVIPMLNISNSLNKSKYIPQLNSLGYTLEHISMGKKLTSKIKSINQSQATIHGEEYFMDRFLHNSLECLIFYSRGDLYNFEQTLAKICNHYLKPLIKDNKKFYNLLFSDYKNSVKSNHYLLDFAISLDKDRPQDGLKSYIVNFLDKLNNEFSHIESNTKNLNNNIR